MRQAFLVCVAWIAAACTRPVGGQTGTRASETGSAAHAPAPVTSAATVTSTPATVTSAPAASAQSDLLEEWFLEVPAPGAPPYAWGPYWVCSLAEQAPACSRMTQHESRGPWSVEPWKPKLPSSAKPRGLVGLYQGVPHVLDGDGVWWRHRHDGWQSAAETRGTTEIAGYGGMICGATAKGVWCSGETPVTRFDVGQPVELVVRGHIAAFALENGRVGLIDGSSYKPLALVWSSALANTKSLTILQSRHACGLTSSGQIACVTVAAPDQPLSLGGEELGGKVFFDGNRGISSDGASFVALGASGAALFALAKDGRLFAARPPSKQGTVLAVDGVDLLGRVDVCVTRRSGPWLCTH